LGHTQAGCWSQFDDNNAFAALVQKSLDAIADIHFESLTGPVGEALIMTTHGLAVAIPAVLAYNAFNRRNRMRLARLESFLHALYVLLTIKAGNNGQPVNAVHKR
jgi:biopolymer transport protein ExbB